MAPLYFARKIEPVFAEVEVQFIAPAPVMVEGVRGENAKVKAAGKEAGIAIPIGEGSSRKKIFTQIMSEFDVS